ncbi:MAG: OmpH family outer membrane protein [Psychromonas sp.]|nr:OmpH family outer membrane protein [Psychromonas sp.]
MKTFLKIATLAVVMASSSLVSAAQETPKIAVVFPSKVMQQSPQFEKMKKKLAAEFKGRFSHLQALEKEIKDIESKLKRDSELMSVNEINNLKRKRAIKVSEYKIEREAFSEDNHRREAEEQQKSWASIRNVINNIAAKKGYDVVLSGEQILFSKPELDISDSVIKEISKK